MYNLKPGASILDMEVNEFVCRAFIGGGEFALVRCVNKSSKFQYNTMCA